MAFRKSGSDEPPPEPRLVEPANREQVPEASLLEQVLQETLASNAAASSLDERELRTLVHIAERHPGSELVLEPIAVELVESLLLLRFGHLAVGETVWRGVSQDIARSLFESPHSHAQLTRFWKQLSELVP